MSKSRQQQRRDARSNKRSNNQLKYLIAIGAVLAIGAAALLILQPGAPAEEEPVNASETGTNLIEPDSYTLGSPNAPVTLVEFLDPECESCRAMHPTVKRVLDTYKDDVQYVVRYMPLHRNSVLAVKVLEAAGLQGKYWEMLDVLFEMQPDWGEKAQAQTALLLHYARELGLDMEALQRDMNRPEFEQKIARDKAAGQALGVEGTPTFFINGTMAGTGMSYNQMSSKIEEHLR